MLEFNNVFFYINYIGIPNYIMCIKLYYKFNGYKNVFLH